MKIYLAGAMSGIEWEEAVKWRSDVIEYFTNNSDLTVDLEIFDPTRYVSDGLFSSDSEDMVFDLYNLRKSDIMICNWDNDSIGTAIEIGVAKENNIPIVVYATDFDRIAKLHPWVKNSALRVFSDFNELLEYVNTFFI